MDAPTTHEAPPDEPTTAADATAPQPRPSRRLIRSTDDRVIAGVAAGIADYYAIEPLLVRLGFVVAAFFGGIGVVAYIVAWIVLPPAASEVGGRVRRVDTQQLLGFGLVALGLAVVPGSLGFGIGGGAFWPVALIAIGVAVLWLRTGDSRSKLSTGAGSSGSVAPPTVPPTATAPMPAAAVETPPPPAPPQPPAPPAAAARPPSVPRPARPKSYLSAITLSALLILAGGAWLIDLAGIAHVDVAIVFALALAVVGIALVASAWYGRARGLIVLGILLAFVVAGFGVIDVPLRGGIGDPTYRPHALAAVDTSYELAIGKMVVDLRDVDFSSHQRSVHATVGIGDLDVLVPEGVRVIVDGHAGAGSVFVLGRRSQTCCPTDVRRVISGVGGGGTLRIDAEVGAGTVEIKR